MKRRKEEGKAKNQRVWATEEGIYVTIKKNELSPHPTRGRADVEKLLTKFKTE